MLPLLEPWQQRKSKSFGTGRKRTQICSLNLKVINLKSCDKTALIKDDLQVQDHH